MKKIYFILSLAVIALLSSCSEDFNEHNFPGYKDASNPTNVAAYNYTLTDADYTTIANAIKKPVTDSIATFKTLLKTANQADSITINASINRLNNRLTTETPYINATYIATNKFFDTNLKAMDYMPYLLSQKYLYSDNASTIKVAYNNVNSGDTTSISTVSKFTLTNVDYALMGTDLNQPGVKNNFTSTMSVMTYLNNFLKLKCPYAATNDIKMVKYAYYDSNKATKKQYRILTFDGQNWIPTPDQFMVKENKWVYDPTITLSLKQVSGNNPYIMKFIDYLRTTTPDKFYQKNTYINEEHYYGFSAYYAQVTYTADRTTYGDAAIKALKTDVDKYALFNQRLKEAMPLFTQLNFPSLQTNVYGIQQYVVVTITSYYSSSKSGLLTIKMKCTKSGTSTTPAEYAVDSIVETF